MHRGWSIPEVVALICGIAEFPTLAALAQTCQAFQAPAFSVLWRDQSDLMQLLKCLPSDLWELEVEDDFGPTLRFRRSIIASDWTRVLFYAVYVKSLIENGQLPVTAEIYATLSVSLPKYPLFPNLRHLTWSTRDDVFPYIRILVGDKLKSIVLSMQGSKTIRSSLLLSLTTSHPTLTHVEFVTVNNPPMIIQAIHSAICSWNHLEKLRSNTLDLPSMLHLARLPNLKSLRLDHFPSYSTTTKELEARVASTGPAFAPLREFIVYSDPILDITSFLDVIEPDALDKIQLSIEAPTVTEDWQTLNASLACKSSKTLTELSLRENFSYDHEIPDSLERMLTTDSLRPLLSFANLVEVAVVAGHGIDLDDAFLEEMALAWPQLQKLDLSPGCQSARYVPQITLAGLIPLAQHCPSLASLALVMNATDVDPFVKEKPGRGITNRSLVDLNVVESPLTSPGAVASFLSAIFPNLQRVTTRDEMARNPLSPDWDDNMFHWSTVSTLVQVISSARAQEHWLPART
ncbi:hypothetical protein DFH07DRAFT_791174 [Mycena maculata]|uniref:F-box domain-containing protein n=1 Tax=Mycena maculata TaxID=230809 RepID=A0AAD7KDK1_9AGAR|nr:hypothetical protein DFH07DRAFT_791174 [Mycena maculata]